MLASLDFILNFSEAIHLILDDAVIVAGSGAVVVGLDRDIELRRLLLIGRKIVCRYTLLIQSASRPVSVLRRRTLRISIELGVNQLAGILLSLRVLLLAIGLVHLVDRCMDLMIIVNVLPSHALLLLSFPLLGFFHLLHQ